MVSKIAELRMKNVNGGLEEDLTLEEALEKVVRERDYEERAKQRRRCRVGR